MYFISSTYSYNSPQQIQKYARDNYRLVPYFSRPYVARNNLNYDQKRELIQEGTIGLMYAARKYNETKGFAFSTYSSRWIKKYMGDYIKTQFNSHLPLKDETIIQEQFRENYDYLLTGLTEQEKKLIVKRYIYKIPVNKLAKEYGCCRNTITIKCKKIIKKIRRINV
jgi:RNA polymerase sigma factor (sigma-70 family)